MATGVLKLLKIWNQSQNSNSSNDQRHPETVFMFKLCQGSTDFCSAWYRWRQWRLQKIKSFIAWLSNHTLELTYPKPASLNTWNMPVIKIWQVLIRFLRDLFNQRISHMYCISNTWFCVQLLLALYEVIRHQILQILTRMARDKVRGSLQSLGCILWEPSMSVQCFFIKKCWDISQVGFRRVNVSPNTGGWNLWSADHVT